MLHLPVHCRLPHASYLPTKQVLRPPNPELCTIRGQCQEKARDEAARGPGLYQWSHTGSGAKPSAGEAMMWRVASRERPCQASGSWDPTSASGGGDRPWLGIPSSSWCHPPLLPFLTTLVVTSCQGLHFIRTIFILQTVKPTRREVRPARGCTGSNEEALAIASVILFFASFYLEIIPDLQKSCLGSTKNSPADSPTVDVTLLFYPSPFPEPFKTKL